MTAAAIPRHLFDALTVLAFVFALLFLYLIFKIIEFRGDGGDDDKKNLRGFSPIPPDEESPPTRAAVLSPGTPCCPIQVVMKKAKKVTA